MLDLSSRRSFTVCFLFIIPLCVGQGNEKCNRLSLATWNIGLEEKQATERTSSIIHAIRNSDADIIALQEAWGGPQILRTIYQAVKSKYPNFQVVDDSMREYINADRIPNQAYSPACPAAGIIAFETCFFPACSKLSGIPQLLCAINQCPKQFFPLYLNLKCWSCVFDRLISRGDPFGINYCGAVNLPQFVDTSPGIVPNSTEAPWGVSIGLMTLSTKKYPLEKIKAALFSESFISVRGYIIVGANHGQLIIANTHAATVDTGLPHPLTGTFLNNTYGSWADENKGQIKELEAIVWHAVTNGPHGKRSAVMMGDFNMGIASFAHNVSNVAPNSWYYIKGLKDLSGKSRWYDDYTEKKNLCTGCIDNYVLSFQQQFIYDHLFTHGPLFSSSDLFTKRIFDEYVQIVLNKTKVTTSLSDHYGIQMITN